MITPRPLRPGDTVAIVAPAGRFDHSLLAPACDTLRQWGYHVRVMPHVTGAAGTYSGTVADRLADMADAIADPCVRALVCARGGYGAVQLLRDVSCLPLADDPKWLVGFSDISALHAAFSCAGVASVHGSMLRGLARGADDAENRMLHDILCGRPMRYTMDSTPYNICGRATGVLVGGNLSVLSALIGTPYDVIRPGSVVLIEDINEPMYKVDRMLWQLRLSGVLPRLRGLMVGRFTGTVADRNHQSVYELVRDMVADYGYPVAMGVPVGHDGPNVPVVLGAEATLTVGDDVRLVGMD